MLTIAAILVGVLLALFLWGQSKKRSPEAVRDSTPGLERVVREAVEDELAEKVLGVRAPTPEERKKLAGTLANEPDHELVGKIEELVRGVDLEFLRYAHEDSAQVTVRVRYEDGTVGSSTRRLPVDEIPSAVRADFDEKATTRVFRAWAFPWQRVRVL